MSLAARCPACRTAFRVVQDQLRVSDGWVRCGRCGEVFNANETLFDLRALTPAPATPQAPPPPDVGPSHALAATQAPERLFEPAPEPSPDPSAVAPHGTLSESPAPAPGLGTAEIPQAADVVHATEAAQPPQPVDDLAPFATGSPLDRDERIEPTFELPPAAIDASPTPESEPAPAPLDADALHASLFAPPEAQPAEPVVAAVQPGTSSADLAADGHGENAPEALADAAAQPAGEAGAPTETPAFLRDAERAARWRSAEMRAFLGGAAVLLAGAALIQAARGFHEPVSLQWPGARVWLDPLCRLAGCQREPRRHLDGLSVEGSSLAKVNGSDLMRLSLVLRNRDRSELLLPAIELSLTDVQGTTVARKVFPAGELGASGDTIAAGGEIALQAMLDTGGLAVTGYAVELFYP